MTSVLQPAAANAACTSMSRSTFRENFASQNSTRLFGVRQCGHPSWRCQKQPCTKIARRSPRMTMSGRPGNSGAWSLYRTPAACSVRRTIISGFVSLCRTRAITSERVKAALRRFTAPTPQGHTGSYLAPCIGLRGPGRRWRATPKEARLVQSTTRRASCTLLR